jgi:quinoprotein glucose dehydrogenase
MLTVVTGWVLVVLGALLGVGGAWLAFLGGSWAYIALGIWLLITGVLLARRRLAGLAVYAAMLVATLIWALWEVGLDRWALIPRGAFFAVVGLWLMTSWVCKPLRGARDTADAAAPSSWRGPTGRKLWQPRLPAGGQATPMTYRINGKQMVVVAAGGHGSFGTTLRDAIVAYALK